MNSYGFEVLAQRAPQKLGFGGTPKLLVNVTFAKTHCTKTNSSEYIILHEVAFNYIKPDQFNSADKKTCCVLYCHDTDVSNTDWSIAPKQADNGCSALDCIRRH